MAETAPTPFYFEDFVSAFKSICFAHNLLKNRVLNSNAEVAKLKLKQIGKNRESKFINGFINGSYFCHDIYFNPICFIIMAAVKYYLRNLTAATPQPIYLTVWYKRERLVMPTGEKVQPEYWNGKKQRVKNTTNVPERDAINATLSDLEKEAERFAAETKTRQAFSLVALKAHLETFLGRSRPKMIPLENMGFMDYVRHYIKASETRTIPKSGELVHPNTIRKYKSTLAVIEAFAATYPRRVNFDTIDLEFHRDFTEWLQNRPHRKGNGYTPNAIGKHIGTIKGFLNAATLDGANKNTVYKSQNFNATKEESDSVYLSAKEVAALFQFDLSGHPRLERVRDLFVVGCWTGLRFSDVARLDPEKHVKGDYIHIEQYKTGGRVVIPLHPLVRAVFDKYGGRLPKMISNQKFNSFIKEVCKMAGLNERVQRGITRGGNRLYLTYQKWELVSSHTARRSFATNLYNDGNQSFDIMQITGHRSEKAFRKYIKTTPEQSAKRLKMKWDDEETNAKTNHLKKVG